MWQKQHRRHQHTTLLSLGSLFHKFIRLQTWLLPPPRLIVGGQPPSIQASVYLSFSMFFSSFCSKFQIQKMAEKYSKFQTEWLKIKECNSLEYIPAKKHKNWFSEAGISQWIGKLFKRWAEPGHRRMIKCKVWYFSVKNGMLFVHRQYGWVNLVT